MPADASSVGELLSANNQSAAGVRSFRINAGGSVAPDNNPSGVRGGSLAANGRPGHLSGGSPNGVSGGGSPGYSEASPPQPGPPQPGPIPGTQLGFGSQPGSGANASRGPGGNPLSRQPNGPPNTDSRQAANEGSGSSSREGSRSAAERSMAEALRQPTSGGRTGQPRPGGPTGDGQQQGGTSPGQGQLGGGLGISLPGDIGNLAQTRGDNWAVDKSRRGSFAILRDIRVEVHADKLVLAPKRRNTPAEEISFQRHAVLSLDTFVESVGKRVKSWGVAGQHMHWQPSIVFDVQPGGQQRYEQLDRLLEDSGLRFRESD
ncbi:MAG: hypothetical protein N2C14_11820 [Planctomycetales bacterium]